MNFNESFSLENVEKISSTAQSEIFFNISRNSAVKKFIGKSEVIREIENYRIIGKLNAINLPEIYSYGSDYIEMELLNRSEQLSDGEIIDSMTNLYLKTTSPFVFPENMISRDLSKQKVSDRLSYLPKELAKRGLDPNKLQAKCTKFCDYLYRGIDSRCLVHGDLKRVHVFKNEKGVIFLDLGQVCLANPFYDVAFMIMERFSQLDKINEFAKILNENLSMGNVEFAKQNLKSMLFYRALYDVIYACRHKPDKTLQRTVNDLESLLIYAGISN